jgi:hypothetical protein
MRRLCQRVVLLALVVTLVIAGPAFSALRDEVASGQAMAEKLQSGEVRCEQLSDADFEHVGESVMNRMAGSIQLHEAMNARMQEVMGVANTDRMHIRLGRRFTGCGVESSGAPGPGMMGGMMGPGGWDDPAIWNRMMNSPMWSWMSSGAWQQWRTDDWQRVADSWMGPGMMASRRDAGRDVGSFALIVIAALLAAGLAGGAIVWRRSRPDTPTNG